VSLRRISNARYIFVAAFCIQWHDPVAAQLANDVATLREELESLRVQQKQTAARIDSIEAAIDQLASSAKTAPPANSSATTAAIPPLSAFEPVAVQTALNVSGDLRLRYESNFGARGVKSRDRAVLRARLRGSYAVAEWLSVGAQLTTGDPDGPNSSDVTLSNFNDDLQVSLDQAWIRAQSGGIEVIGGKIPLPFVRTDMVWDGDVYPQGFAASFTKKSSNGSLLKATGLYFIVDEDVAGPDSHMVGAQVTLEANATASLKFGASLAYYNYTLTSTAGGDVGDFRSNGFANGRYLSDFDLFDIIGSVSWSGLGKRWLVKLTADYVRNFGAITRADTGLSFSGLVGRLADRSDWRIGYGYSSVETDAVLAAFSEDNTTLATNYLQHNLSIEYVLRPKLVLGGYFYRFKPKNSLDAGSIDADDWVNRLRINLSAEF
jgi:hypothetical protein